MKKMSLVVLALTLTIGLFSIANAGYRNGPGGGCGGCGQQPEATSEQLRKFQADTIDLRQEMMNKRFEAQRENQKATPDAAKIASLEADITAIQTKMLDLRSKSGLQGFGDDGEFGKRCGGAAQNGMGFGMGMRGCNGVPCSQQR